MQNLILTSALTLTTLTLTLILTLTACDASIKPQASESEINEPKTTEPDSKTTTAPNWQPLHDNLYKSNTGEIGFKVDVLINPETIEFKEDYVTHLNINGNTIRPIKEVVDLDSFHYLDDNLGDNLDDKDVEQVTIVYQDKNHRYHFHPMARGGAFYVADDIDNEAMVENE